MKLQIDYIKLSETQAVVKTNGYLIQLKKDDFFKQGNSRPYYYYNSRFDIGVSRNWGMIASDNIDEKLLLLIREVKRYNGENESIDIQTMKHTTIE